jgi:O-antigen/teichoic acid export membrane protein
MAMQLATFLATFSDRFFLQAYADEAKVGLYNISYTFGFLLVTIGFTPMDTVWGPKRFHVARQDNRDRVLSRGFLIHNVLVFTVAVEITLYVGDALKVMTTEDYWPAARVVPVILVAYILQCWASVQDIGILVSEKTQYLTIANVVAALVAVVGFALLVPPYLEWGAAIATVVAFATRYGMTFWFSQRLWPVRYEWGPVLVVAAWSVAIAGASLLLPPMEIVASLAVRTALVLTFGVGLWILPILDTSQRAEVMRAVRWAIAAGKRRVVRRGS